jgi:putative addiction module antidote
MSYNLRYNKAPATRHTATEVLISVLKVITVGNSVGVILPKEILERLRVKRGDSLYVVETKNGIELTAYNPAFANQVETAERVMREDRDALQKLAK